jgi:hypothetical protein
MELEKSLEQDNIDKINSKQLSISATENSQPSAKALF